MRSRRQLLVERLVSWSPALLLGGLAAMTYWLNIQVRVDLPEFDGTRRHDPDLYAEEFKAVSLDADGRVRQSLTAARARHYPDDDVTAFDKPVIVFTDPDKPRLDVSADRGTITGDREHVYLDGHVRVVREAAGGDDSGGPITVTSDHFEVLPKEERAFTDRQATITDPRGTVTATGVELDNKAKTIRFRSRLSGQLQPQNHPR